MNTEEINALIKEYEVKLAKLQPTLRATGDINYSKIGLLNSARHKEKLYRQNITLLRILSNDPEAVPEELLKAALSGVKPPATMVRPAGTPFEQEGLWEAPLTEDTMRVIKSIQSAYIPTHKPEEPPVMAYIPSKEQMVFVENPAKNDTGKQIAQALGIKYDGIQPGYEDIPDSMQFTDPETGSTHLGDSEAQVKQKIESRAKFKKSENSNIVRDVLDRMRIESTRPNPHEETVEETIRRVYGK